MSVASVQSGIVKRALAILHEGVNVQDWDEDAKLENPEAATAETVATQVLAEYQPSEAHLIVNVWRDAYSIQFGHPF